MTPSMGIESLALVGGILGSSHGMVVVWVQVKMNSSVGVSEKGSKGDNATYQLRGLVRQCEKVD